MTLDPLNDALRAVAAEDRRLSASAAVEARVVAEARAIARRRHGQARAVQLAAAAVMFVAVALPLWPRRGGETTTGEDRPAASMAPNEVMTEFFPLTYSGVPAPGGQIVRMQVPRAALERFGVASFETAGDDTLTVMAEVVVGNDGLARAVRFVRAAGAGERQEQKQ
jgi:hypothetical protein